jgi:predicted nucleic acid-binding protein
MTVYAETSAVLRWLLGAARGDDIRARLGEADAVVASRLTEAEAKRTLLRLVATKALTEAQALSARTLLAKAAATWALLEIDASVLERAASAFPAEPVRALDAIHLASALRVREEVDDLHVLTTDDRILRNTRELGLTLALE